MQLHVNYRNLDCIICTVSGMVQASLVHRVIGICGVLQEVLTSDPKGVEQNVGQLPELIRLIYQLIQR